MLELFVEFIPSLDCWNNWLSNHGFELAFTLILFAWGCEMYCSYRSVNEILSKHHLRKCTHNSDSLRKRSLRFFNKMSAEYLFIEWTKTSLYGIWVEMPFLCSKLNWSDTPRYMMPDWRTCELTTIATCKGCSLISDFGFGWSCYLL